MTLRLSFEFASEILDVFIEGHNILFKKNGLIASIDGIKLNRLGIIKEFPDLKDNKDWKKIAIERFNEKIKKMNNEKEIMVYIIKELSQLGYKPLTYQEKGFRVKRII